MGIDEELRAASPSVIRTNTPIKVPLGAISKMMFLLGSDRSTLLTNMAGEPLKMPSESNVMLYQLTRPGRGRVSWRRACGVELVGSIWLSTVFKSKKTLVWPVAGSTR